MARVFRRVVPPQRVDPPSSVVSSRDALCAPQVPSYSQSGRSNVADGGTIAVNALPCGSGRRGGVDDADGDVLPQEYGVRMSAIGSSNHGRGERSLLRREGGHRGRLEDADGDVALSYNGVAVTIDGATEHGGDERPAHGDVLYGRLRTPRRRDAQDGTSGRGLEV